MGHSSARRKNVQNTDLSPMKSENAVKTKNPPEEKNLRGIISLFLVMMELLISNRALDDIGRTAELVNDEEHVADVNVDATLELWVELEVA